MALVAVIVMSQLASAGLLERLRLSRCADEFDGRRHGRWSGQVHSRADNFNAGPRASPGARPGAAEAGRDADAGYPRACRTGYAGPRACRTGRRTRRPGRRTRRPGRRTRFARAEHSGPDAASRRQVTGSCRRADGHHVLMVVSPTTGDENTKYECRNTQQIQSREFKGRKRPF